MSARVSRRAVLATTAGATGLAVSGCTLGGPRERPRRGGDDSAPPEEDPDVAVATEALAAVETVLALAVATGSRHPDLAAGIADTVAVHERHGSLLVDAVPGAARPRPTNSPTEAGSPGSPDPTTTPSPTVDVPRSPARALARLVAAERTLVSEGKRLAFAAQSGAFARVLGSLAASAAQQAVVLSARDPGLDPGLDPGRAGQGR